MSRTDSSASRTVHVIPVFAPTDEAGWLVYTGRRTAAIARDLDTLGEQQCTWEAPVKSWFFRVESTGRALDALTSATQPKGFVLCAGCLEGRPCERWMKVPRAGFTKRDPTDDGYDGPEPEQGSEWWRQYSRPGPGAESPHVESDDDDEDPVPLSDVFEMLFDAANDRVKRWRTQRRRRGAQPPPRAQRHAPPPPSPSSGMTPHEAAALVGVTLPCTAEQLAVAFKKAALAAHPDRGGSNEKMAKINAARDVLKKKIGS